MKLRMKKTNNNDYNDTSLHLHNIIQKRSINGTTTTAVSNTTTNHSTTVLSKRRRLVRKHDPFSSSSSTTTTMPTTTSTLNIIRIPPVTPDSTLTTSSNNKSLFQTPTRNNSNRCSSNTTITSNTFRTPTITNSSSSSDIESNNNNNDYHSSYYHDLYIPPNELRCSRTLITGQCFNWRAVQKQQQESNMDQQQQQKEEEEEKVSAWGYSDATEWIGTIRVFDPVNVQQQQEWSSTIINEKNNSSDDTIVVMIKETMTTTLYRTLYTTNPNLNISSILYQYFQFPLPSTRKEKKNYNNFSSTNDNNNTSESNNNHDYCPIEIISSSTTTTTTTTTSDSSIQPFSSNNNDYRCLQDLYHEWSQQCDRMKIIASHLTGVRIINQDPFYCLLCFLCSSNNNIPRITKMISSIQRTFGTIICTIPQSALQNDNDSNDTNTTTETIKTVIGWDYDNDIDPITGDMIFYKFPSLIELYHHSNFTESVLRTTCGCGYRARYIIETIQRLYEQYNNNGMGETYLHTLRTISDPNYVQEQLIQFTGIGRKVADCIALFSLQQHNTIPVDVHVWNIARRDYNADSFLLTTTATTSKPTTVSKKKRKKITIKNGDSIDVDGTTIQTTKSLTPTIYKQIGDVFRTKFPSYSGWAHSLLFVAELPSFRNSLPYDLVQDMDTFRASEKANKAARKQQRLNNKEK